MTGIERKYLEDRNWKVSEDGLHCAAPFDDDVGHAYNFPPHTALSIEVYAHNQMNDLRRALGQLIVWYNDVIDAAPKNRIEDWQHLVNYGRTRRKA